MTAISDNLIHFLGRTLKESPKKQLYIFKSIIIDGLKCGKIVIKYQEGAGVHNSVVCFTDIPLSHCDEHTAVYGKFGIGFKKSYVKNAGGNPVRYFVNYVPGETMDEKGVENRGLLYLSMCNHYKLLKFLDENAKKDQDFNLYNKEGEVIISNIKIQEWVSEQIAVLSYEKETGDLGPARDDTKDIDLYYKEREWRLVPTLGSVISGSVQYYEKDNTFFYPFTRSDVNVIVTPNDEIRTEVLKFFLILEGNEDQKFRDYAENPPPVITYDDLHRW